MITYLSPIQQSQILSALFSPAFPVGAFSYSHGMEAAIAGNQVVDAASAHDWIRTCLVGGSARNDAIIMTQLWRESEMSISDLNDLAFALCSSSERLQETRELGESFRRSATKAYAVDWPIDTPIAYPVATGICARQLGCDADLSLVFFLQAFVSNLVSVAVRAVPIGQVEGQTVLRRLMPDIEAIASEAVTSDLNNLGGYAFGADQAAQIHETMETRIYRT